jgi:hypothetical protein
MAAVLASRSSTNEVTVTHVSDIIAPDHGKNNAVFVTPLTLVRRQDLDQRVFFVYQRR